jgi:predicted unusual protein kinase regulating ubiquinone biosynthesis (AarF/ABC1/UbiB family)
VEAQETFARVFRDYQDFVVPPVLDVAERVLVSEWVDGTPMAQVARHGDRAERDRAGFLLSLFLLSCPRRVGRLHSDPHPGNFRLLSDGRLAVVYSCSTPPLSDGYPGRLVAVLRAGRQRDGTRLFEVAETAGLVRGGEVTPSALLELLDPVLEPPRQEDFAFTREWLRFLTVRLSDLRSAASRTRRKLRIPVRFLLAQRVAASTTGVLYLLGATVPLSGEAAAWLPGFGGVQD